MCDWDYEKARYKAMTEMQHVALGTKSIQDLCTEHGPSYYKLVEIYDDCFSEIKKRLNELEIKTAELPW